MSKRIDDLRDSLNKRIDALQDLLLEIQRLLIEIVKARQQA
ncbi:hypothetical protein TUZN_0952 [Thermoproteus uzoniensis 768-20]|uniref:Uncharacterized protein n=1 Tax=Thermoproteus uzoniensis (strain 768-20) TaxID=999630 RepID=F2L5Z0_THEU7|nr:hypothetical protein TUZN_0952 [Thermoproteus uzoniensis 768-20]